MSTIEEIKIHKNKGTQCFLCTVVRRDAGYLVISFHSDKEYRINDIIIPRGSTTMAHHWTDRGYVLWRMFASDGSLIGTLFHICKDVLISDQSVSYLDLIVDIWVTTEGDTRVLDEDELEECEQKGLLTDQEKQWIEKQKMLILDTHVRIIEEL
jgi:hypothetical protein